MGLMLLKVVLAYHIHNESFGWTLNSVVQNRGVASSNPANVNGFFTRGVWQNMCLGPPLILPCMMQVWQPDCLARFPLPQIIALVRY